MTVVTMSGWRPPPRDDMAWTALLIEESADGLSSMGQIENKSMITGPGLSPLGLDNDPKYPVAREWTTEFATLPPGGGYYRVRFRDNDGNLSEYTEWASSATQPWVPSLRDVAVHIRNRTVERASNKFLGTFTSKTRPTDEEAWETIGLAIDDIEADTGRLDRPGIGPVSWKAVKSLAALRAAMLIERSYYGEQIGTNKSPYPALERDWERRLPKVVDAVAEDLVAEVEPTPDSDNATGGGTTPTVDNDLVVPSGSRVLSKAGTWVGTGTATFTPGPEDPGNIDYGTKF